MGLRETNMNDRILAMRILVGSIQNHDEQVQLSMRQALLESDIDTVINIVGLLSVPAGEKVVEAFGSADGAIEWCQEQILQMTATYINDENQENR